jgi:hypothetical protein
LYASSVSVISFSFKTKTKSFGDKRSNKFTGALTMAVSFIEKSPYGFGADGAFQYITAPTGRLSRAIFPEDMDRGYGAGDMHC